MPPSLAKQSSWRECNFHVEHECTMLVSQQDKRHCVGGSYSGVRLPRDCLYFPSLQELISACLMNVGIHTPLHLVHSRLKILQEGSLTGRTPDAVTAEVLEVTGLLSLLLYYISNVVGDITC